ncbi:MAG TPA: ABC transporter permease [Gemmatimonadales bacterium]|nr:ABC transporter permease [Gemmatimonadales bacterium]
METEVLGIAALSLKVALTATVFACLIGIPLGFMLGASRLRGRRAVLLLLNTALAFPTVVIGLAIYGLLARRGPLGGLGLLFSWQAIVIAEVILALPIATALSAAAVQAVDPRVRRTALTLGAGPLRTAWAVAREARFALAAAVVVAFGRVLSEVGAALIVGGNIRHETRTLTTAITLATSQGNFSLAVALGLVLLALALTVNVLIQMLQGRGDV